jgi:hypothetical protein
MPRSLMLCLLLPLLAACQQDQFEMPGTWHSQNLNDANLREMVANPTDYVVGQSAPDVRGQSAAVAVKRLLTDKQRAISGASTSSVGNLQGPVASGGGDAAAGH